MVVFDIMRSRFPPSVSNMSPKITSKFSYFSTMSFKILANRNKFRLSNYSVPPLSNDLDAN